MPKPERFRVSKEKTRIKKKMKKIGATNPHTRALISELKKLSAEKKAPIWKTVAFELGRPARQRREVNLSRLQSYAKEKEIALVPGKVLGAGDLNKKITVVAWKFSNDAFKKIQSAGSKAMSIPQLMKENPAGKKVRIIG